MQDEKKYYFIRSKGLAETIRYISQTNYLTFKDKNDNNREIYSFEDSQNFQNLLSSITLLCKEFRN